MDEVDEEKVRNLAVEYRKEVKEWFSKSCFGLFLCFPTLVLFKTQRN